MKGSEHKSELNTRGCFCGVALWLAIFCGIGYFACALLHLSPDAGAFFAVSGFILTVAFFILYGYDGSVESDWKLLERGKSPDRDRSGIDASMTGNPDKTEHSDKAGHSSH